MCKPGEIIFTAERAETAETEKEMNQIGKFSSGLCALRVSAVQFVFILLLVGCSSGSGDSGWHWGSVHRQDIHSVALPVFTTRDYHRGVEYELSDALAKKVEEFTPYKVEPKERADTILEGEIISITPTTLTLNPFTATPQEQQYSVIVNFTWKDLRTGKILVSRQAFEQATTYFPYLGEGQNIASESAVEKLALGIVNEMEGPW
jgi:hypothetical protein